MWTLLRPLPLEGLPAALPPDSWWDGSPSHSPALLKSPGNSLWSSSPWTPALEGLLMTPELFWDRSVLRPAVQKHILASVMKFLVMFYRMKPGDDFGCLQTSYHELHLALWDELSVTITPRGLKCSPPVGNYSSQNVQIYTRSIQKTKVLC